MSLSDPSTSKPRFPRRPVQLGAVVVALAIGVGLFYVFRDRRAARPEEDPKSSSVDSSSEKVIAAVVNPGYVGPDSCAECHRERVAEFKQTRHYSACREPVAGKMPTSFAPGQGRFHSRDPHLQFDMIQTDQGFFQSTIHEASGQTQTTRSRIDLAYGAPPTDEVYFTWRDDRLFELPIAWLHPQQQWGASAFDPDGAGDYSRPLTVRCLECHNTWFEHQPGTLNQYRRDHFILGVTCERCHGPGKDHVTYHREHPQETASHAILHPGRLSRDRLMDLCAQCHSNAIKHRGPAFSYRPGEPLESSYKTVSSRHPEDDHVANQVKYLKQSKCYQQSDKLTCVTCHDPHKPHQADANPLEGAHSTEAQSCRQCHQSEDCHERSRLPAAVQDNCIGCHMPARDKIQVYFDTETDVCVAPVKAYEHRIGIHPTATQEVLLEWRMQQTDDESRREAERLKQSLARHYLDEGDRLRGDYRHLAAIDAYRQSIRLDPAPESKKKLAEAIEIRTSIDDHWFRAVNQIRQQQYSEAATTLETILSLKPDLAKVHGKLGAVYASLNRRDKAVEHLQAVLKFDPDDAYGEGMLGWLDYLDGRFQSATEHFRRADEIEPYKAKVQLQWGLALMKRESWDDAAQKLQQALTIDPRQLDACMSLSQVRKSQGRLTESIELASRAVAMTQRQNPELLLYLGERLAEEDRIDEARQLANEAMELARQHRPDLVPRIRLQLAQYEVRSKIRKP
jgi:Flp pilus assembly protein TadD